MGKKSKMSMLTSQKTESKSKTKAKNLEKKFTKFNPTNELHWRNSTQLKL